MRWPSLTRHVMPVLGVLAFAGAVLSVAARPTPPTAEAPPLPTPTSPFEARIAARGLIEPQSETIAVATELGGVIEAVHVTAGQRVRRGDPLLALDGRSWRAALDRARAEAGAARAARAEAEAVVALREAEAGRAVADVTAAEAERDRAAADALRYERLVQDAHASGQQADTARANARKADAALAAARRGAEAAARAVEVARAQRASAEARVVAADASVATAAVEVDRTVVRAPIDGEVLRVEARVGEWAAPGAATEPLVRLGATDVLHVRAEIDEADAPRLVPGAPAVAGLRGSADRNLTLRFVRIEPYVVPKRQLSTGTAERVDTRVLQVIYALDGAPTGARVGQQVDVMIATDAGASAPDSSPVAEPAVSQLVPRAGG